MNPFSKTYQPVIQAKEVKASKSPKAKPNVFDTGTPCRANGAQRQTPADRAQPCA